MSTLSPGANSHSQVPCYTAGTDVFANVENSPGLCDLKCGVLLIGQEFLFYCYFSQFFQMTLSMQQVFHPCNNSNGENPVEACETSDTANYRCSSHLSQLRALSCKKLTYHDFKSLIKSFDQPIRMINAGVNQLNPQ